MSSIHTDPHFTAFGWPVRVVSFGIQDWYEFGGIDIQSPTFVYFAGDPEGADEWLAIGVGDEISDEIALRSVREFGGGESRLRTLVPYLGEAWEMFADGDDIALEFALVQRRTDTNLLATIYAAIEGLPPRDLRALRHSEITQIDSDSVRDL